MKNNLDKTIKMTGFVSLKENGKLKIKQEWCFAQR